MRITTFSRAGGLMLAAVLTAANLTGSAQAAEETGTVSGTFTDGAGLPMTGVVVKTESLTTLTTSGQGLTGADGHYSIPGVGTGSHRVRFEPPGYQLQYAYQQPSASTAAAVMVTAGATTSVDDSLMAFGTFTGRLTARDRNGLAGVRVQHSEGSPYLATTDAGGYFTIHRRPGTYTFSFSLPNNGQAWDRIHQYLPQTDNRAKAGKYTIAAGQTIEINDAVLPNGYLTGVFRDEYAQPMSGVYVQVTSPSSGRIYGVLTDDNGAWKRRVVAGNQVVEFERNSPFYVNQFAYSQPLREGAAAIPVQDGQTVTVNDARMTSGSAKITARDAVSGELLQDFDTWLSPYPSAAVPGPEPGTKIVNNAPPGRYSVFVSAYGYARSEAQIKIDSGQQTAVEVVVQRRTRIDATIIDRATNQPVAGVCLFPASSGSFLSNYAADCHQSGPDGKATVEVPNDGSATYQVFALPVGTPAKGYGAQWVGPAGGTGTQAGAISLTVVAGQAAQAPLIKLDRAGTITGRVTTPSGGLAENTFVAVTGLRDDMLTGRSFSTGDYTLGFLGPYAWPLRVASSEGIQYSGGTGNRLEAELIQVRADAITRYDFRLHKATSIDIRVPWRDAPCRIEVVNANTGDIVGTGYPAQTQSCAIGNMHIPVVPGQHVKLRMIHGNADYTVFYTTWYGSLNFASTPSFWIDGPRTMTFEKTIRSPRVEDPPPTQVPVPRPTVTPSAPPVPRL